MSLLQQRLAAITDTAAQCSVIRIEQTTRPSQKSKTIGSEIAIHEADRIKMFGMQWHWLSRGNAASAAGPQNLFCTMHEMRW